MTKNTGKASEAIFEGHWEARGKLAYLERRYDLAFVRGYNPGIHGLKFPPQPSDYLLTVDGQTHYCEVKSCSNKTSFPFGQIEQGQWSALKQVTAAKGSYLFFIHNKLTDEWFRVPGSFILDLEKDFKSVPWDTLRLLYSWFPISKAA
jgi:hypothetical protein